MDAIQNKKTYLSLFSVLNFLILTSVLLLIVFLHYKIDKYKNDKTNNLQLQMQLLLARQELVAKLKVHHAFDKNGPLELKRHGKQNDGGYVVATKALLNADTLLGYGINDDNSFEDQFSQIYHKPSYGFDCGIKGINSNSPLFVFINECIASDSFLNDQRTSNQKTSSFSQQLEKLHLKDKNIFLKMDIEGAEYMAFPDILQYSKQITGIAIEIHFNNLETTKQALYLLRKLEKDFILIHIHGNNHAMKHGFSTPNSIGIIPHVIELSYINKALITKHHVAAVQRFPLAIDQPNTPHIPDAAFEIVN